MATKSSSSKLGVGSYLGLGFLFCRGFFTFITWSNPAKSPMGLRFELGNIIVRSSAGSST